VTTLGVLQPLKIVMRESDGMITPDSICVVGGMGRMGRMLCRLFQEGGCSVRVADRSLSPISWETVAASDVVVLAVPIPEMKEAIMELGPHTRSDGVVIDIASVKENLVELMLQHCNGEVIGSHPFFGPSVGSIKDQILFLCDTGSTNWIQWYRSFYEGLGARVVEIDPASHDRLMAAAQILRHLSLFCLGKGLMSVGFDLVSNLPNSGPWFTELIDMLVRQLEQPAELYADIALHNRYMAQTVEAFRLAAAELCSFYEKGDRSNMTRVMTEISHYVHSDGVKSALGSLE